MDDDTTDQDRHIEEIERRVARLEMLLESLVPTIKDLTRIVQAQRSMAFATTLRLEMADGNAFSGALAATNATWAKCLEQADADA